MESLPTVVAHRLSCEEAVVAPTLGDDDMQIDPSIRKIGPKSGGTGVPPRELIHRVLEVVSDLLFIENLDDLLDEIGRALKELFPIEKLIIWLAEEPDGPRSIRVALGYSEEERRELVALRYSPEEVEETKRLATWVTNMTWFLPAEISQQLGFDERDKLFGLDPDKMKVPRKSPDSWHEMDYLDISFVTRDGRSYGAIEIEGTTDRKIPSIETIRAMELFASICSVAIELATLREKEQAIAVAAERRSSQISRILSFASDVLALKDQRELIDNVLRTLRDLFGFQANSFMLFDQADGCFRYYAIMGYSSEEIEHAKSHRIPYELPLSDLSPEFVIGGNSYFRPAEIITEDYVYWEIYAPGELERLRKLRHEPRKHPRAWHPLDNLIFPMYDRRGTLVGLLYPDRPSDGLIPPPETIEGIEIYTSLVSVALENSRNYFEMIRVKEDIELLNRLLFNDVTTRNAVIRRYLELATQKGLDSQKCLRYLSNALGQLDNTIELIQKVRKLSGIRSEQLSPLLRVDLADAIRSELSRTVHKHQLKTVRVSYPSPLPKDCFVLANDLIGELLHNIVQNAIVHNNSKEVELEVSITGQIDEISGGAFWDVAIADNGIGIPDDRKRSLFDVTDRIGDSTGRTGLGMALIKSIAALYNGFIWVEDRVSGDHSKGSVFHVMLPAA